MQPPFARRDPSNPSDTAPTDRDDFAAVTSDTTIIESRESAARDHAHTALDRVQVGAEVFSSDGALVAVVEIVAPDRIGIRAGSPGRPVDVPARGITSISADGRRVEVRLSSDEIERLAGGDQPGYRHLEAQQSHAIAEDIAEDEPRPPVEDESRG
jgi:hypothetical protein